MTLSKILAVPALSIALVAGMAVAKEGVQNPAVQKRQDLMDKQAGAAKTLGEMAAGKTPFDAAKAADAKATLEETAKQIPVVFEAEETDPKSDAKPEIWSNWDDYVAKADNLEQAALKLDVTSVETVQAGMSAVGGACSACHKEYRMK